MELSDYDLRQLNEDVINSLSPDAVKNLANRLLIDLKVSRERLNQNSQNSSMPPSSEAPWHKSSAHSDDDAADENSESDKPVSATEEDALKTAMQADGNEVSDDALPVADENSSASVNPQETTTVEPAGKPGKQLGAKGFGRTQKIPVHRHQDHQPTECACCSRTFSEAEMESSKAYTAFDSLGIECGNPERPGIHVVNTRHTYYQTECSCGHNTRAVPFCQPPNHEVPGIELSEWRLVDATLASFIVCLSLRLRLSRFRIREFLHDWLGITLSVGTINKTIHESGHAVMPVEAMLIEEVLKSGLLHIDETSWKQKDKLLWLWAFVSTTVVLFKVAQRTAHLFKALIIQNGYPGWIMTDGYQVYREHLKRLRCWAHLIRKARGLAEALDSEAQDFGEKSLLLLNNLIAAVKSAREQPPDQSLSIIYQQPLEEYRQLCEKMRLSRHKKTHELAVEMLNDWTVIFTILDHPHLPLTNNEAERALRHWVILRKICYGTRTAEGSRVFAILASVIETCRIRQCSPWRYLAEVIANRRAGLSVHPLPVYVAGV
jgi:transposase